MRQSDGLSNNYLIRRSTLQSFEIATSDVIEWSFRSAVNYGADSPVRVICVASSVRQECPLNPR
jgi:hypothetical protein